MSCEAGIIGLLALPEAPSVAVAEVCCPAGCNRCGGVDCWSSKLGMLCCARHIFERGVTCASPTQTACVLPDFEPGLVPAETRQPACVDLWSVAYPGEQDDWKVRAQRWGLEMAVVRPRQRGQWHPLNLTSRSAARDCVRRCICHQHVELVGA
eukprot:1355722-Pleurochrysis_carterae.AAC.1